MQRRIGHDHHLTGAHHLRRYMFQFGTRRHYYPTARGKQNWLAESRDDILIPRDRPERPHATFGPVYGILAPQLLPQGMRVVIGEKSRISQRVIDTH
jgi:hypothetical protein